MSSGANVTAVQRLLGHASAAMTLDVYSGLFDDDLDASPTASTRPQSALVRTFCGLERTRRSFRSSLQAADLQLELCGGGARTRDPGIMRPVDPVSGVNGRDRSRSFPQVNGWA